MNRQPENKQNEWFFQWESFYDDKNYAEDNFELFKNWIYPVTLEYFMGKTALDCGCGKGQHLKFLLPFILRGVGVDLNTAHIAKQYINSSKVDVINGDIATVIFPEKFDIVYSIGVLHHTDNPTVSFENIRKQAKQGGKVIVWVYSWEGNFLNRCLLEPLKTIIISRLNRKLLLALAAFITALLYIPIFTVYLLPLTALPFYKYFVNFRKISFSHNLLNVFDKLNAPQTHFIKQETMEKWFKPENFSDVHISHYLGVSWKGSGTIK